jgi:inner membrane protein
MLEQIFDATWAWMIIGAIFVGLELVVPGIFLLWVGLGAIAVGLLLTLLPDLTLPWQLTLFAVAMLASIRIGFVVQRRSYAGPSDTHLNQELVSMLGQRYVAITDFDAGRGDIRVGDASYGVCGENDIRTGDMVEVVRIENGRLRVRKDMAEN